MQEFLLQDPLQVLPTLPMPFAEQFKVQVSPDVIQVPPVPILLKLLLSLISQEGRFWATSPRALMDFRRPNIDPGSPGCGLLA